jgi:DNA polymerase I-like protein with 3'-5' exonuclease and polymerase domains
VNVLIELDKAGAEWVVVAYLSGDVNMLEVIREGNSPHTVTGSLISGAPYDFVEKENKVVGNNTAPDTITNLREELKDQIEEDWFLPRTMSIRQAGKKSNHGLNYDMKYKRFALENEIQEAEAKRLVDLYHNKAYPGIKQWHRSVQSRLRDNRTLENCFGRRCRFMDAWGPDLFNAAYSFLPQSTVFDITLQGMREFYNDETMSDMEILAQVHDSILFQASIDDIQKLAESVVKVGLDYMNPVCVYRSIEFQIGTTMKIGTDWGNMYEVLLSDDIGKTAEALHGIRDVLEHGKEAA